MHAPFRQGFFRIQAICGFDAHLRNTVFEYGILYSVPYRQAASMLTGVGKGEAEVWVRPSSTKWCAMQTRLTAGQPRDRVKSLPGSPIAWSPAGVLHPYPLPAIQLLTARHEAKPPSCTPFLGC